MSVAFTGVTSRRHPCAFRHAFARVGAVGAREAGDVLRRRLALLLSRLRGEDLACALRWRLAPVLNVGEERWCIAGGAVARREAARRGWRILREVPPEVFLDALVAPHVRRLGERAVSRLAGEHPHLSAATRLAPGQGRVVRTLVPALFLFAGVMPLSAALLLFVPALFFLLLAALRLLAVLHAPLRPTPARLSDADLPHYTVLVPVYRETGVIDQLLAALAALDYPEEKRDIKILVEETDHAMRMALVRRALPAGCEVLVVPRGVPRTKPRALDYGLAFARGALLCIYDAEDIPAPDQLRRAAAAFAAASPRVACLQAALGWYNAEENWLTRMIALDYAGHFEVILPYLARMGWPLPLGGTSNHFRTAALRAVGAWDPFNVTEDADLGLRLARFGWRSGVLASRTGEEACVHLRDWIAQRSRWIKGWLQTWLVHLRTHRDYARRTGAGGLLVLHAVIGAGVFAALAHPFFLLWTLWNVLWPGSTAPLLGHSVVTALCVLVLVAGHFSAMALAAVGLHRRDQLHLWPWLFTLPLYWLLISAAAWLALWDFLVRPHHWRKTPHGLSRRRRARGAKGAGAT